MSKTDGADLDTDLDTDLDAGRASSLEQAWQEVQPDAARRLLTAAVDAFAARGYHGTTTRDIADRAGLSPAGVYVHFRSKEELLFRISLIGHQQTLLVVAEAAASADRPVDRLRAVVTAQTEWQARHHTTARVIEYDLPSLAAEHRAEINSLRRAINGVLRDVLERGVAAGELDVPDVAGTALALLSLVTDVARWYPSAGRKSPEKLGQLYADLAVRMAGAR
jgi:AcrR family transcriptional regulator